jgi:hypothetical protein
MTIKVDSHDLLGNVDTTREYENFAAPVEAPIKSAHDMTTTRSTIKHLLSGGTPDWVKHPEDYRAFVKESFQASKEASDFLVRGYKMENQDILTNEKARMVHPIRTRDFIAKLRRNGVKCFTFMNGWPPKTVALWAVKPGTDRCVYIAFMQVPAMWEWSVLRLDKHFLPNGEAYRGWRTVLAQLVLKGVMTEHQAHKVFGKPTDGEVSRIYRHTMWNARNLFGVDNATTAEFNQSR